MLSGAVGGVAIPVFGRFDVIAEHAYHLRRFPSIQWHTSGNRIPARLPREFDFSGPTVAVGLQVNVRRDDP
jgi:hypothetical protein